MMKIFIDNISDLLMPVYAILWFRFFAVKRNKINNFIIVVAAVVLDCLTVILMDIFYECFYIKAVSIIVLITVVMFVLFQISCAKALVLSTFLYGAWTAAEYVMIVILGKVFLLIVEEPMYVLNAFTFYIVAYGSKVILLGIILWTGKRLGRKTHDALTRKEWWIMFSISFITIFFIATIVVEEDLLFATDLGSSYFYIAIGVVVINFIVCNLIYNITEREIQLREHAAFREKIKSETAMYRSTSENLEKQRKRTHEYKNQITTIRALVANERYQELKAYLEKVDNDLQLSMDAVDTNHTIVNAILNTKYREAINNGIVFVLKVNDLSKLKMSEEDIVVILSNLLSNALEAAGRCKDKIVKLKFVLEGEQAVISVKNSMETKPIVEDGRFRTTKTEEAGEHGIGIRNVVETVEKYDGKYVIDYDEGNFQITILIPNN